MIYRLVVLIYLFDEFEFLPLFGHSRANLPPVKYEFPRVKSMGLFYGD